MTLFSLEKTLALLVMPAGLIWLLILAGALLCLRRRQLGLAALGLGIALGYALAGNILFASALLGKLERGIEPVAVAGLEPFDVVCVLGGGTEQNPDGSPELGVAGDRLWMAAKLWHAGKARMLVASGASRDGVHGFRDLAQETRALWRAVGVPDKAILTVAEPCWNTRDEIKAYTKLQARYRWRRMALVSSASHLPRAMALASRAGLAFTPVGADRLGRPHAFQLQFLVPQGLGFEWTQRACWEYVGRWLGM